MEQEAAPTTLETAAAAPNADIDAPDAKRRRRFADKDKPTTTTQSLSAASVSKSEFAFDENDAAIIEVMKRSRKERMSRVRRQFAFS